MVQAAAQTTTSESHEQEVMARREAARRIVRNNVYWAAGLGIVPIPVFDLVGITSVQIRMLKQLSDLYGVRFWQHKVKNILSALIGGFGSIGAGGLFVYSVLKFIPFVGQAAGGLAVPIAGGALTQAVGTVFIQHFESGGTFLDFNPEAVREHFKSEFEAAKPVVEAEIAKTKGPKS